MGGGGAEHQINQPSAVMSSLNKLFVTASGDKYWPLFGWLVGVILSCFREFYCETAQKTKIEQNCWKSFISLSSEGPFKRSPQASCLAPSKQFRSSKLSIVHGLKN